MKNLLNDNNLKRTAVAIVVSNMIVALVCIGLTYVSVAPKIFRTDGQLKLFYESNTPVDPANPPRCENITVAVPTTSGEFLNGIGIKYDFVVGNDFGSEDSTTWVDNQAFLKTPYETSHWSLGYTQEGVPIIFKYSTDTYIETNWNRRATCSDLFEDFYGNDEYFILSGDVYRTTLNMKYVGQTFNSDISNIATASDLSNSKVDNYLAEGRNIPCILIYCDLIYN